ncbi:MAG: RNA methyltransferase [Alphaproteobacteria bacterium]|nr:RNA methyltransferase [Alphaproteobacteria bacterium]
MKAPTGTRGYFAIGVERLSKPMNAGNLFRSAHAFGASFLFSIAAEYRYPKRRNRSDTSRAPEHLPLYEYPDVASLTLPEGCRLIGVELLDEAVVLPSFRHPSQAAYVLGPERGQLSPELLARCDETVKIPTAFSINVATAGAILMYDRLISLGRFARRPVSSLAEPEPLPVHVQGAQIIRGAPRKETAE